MTDERLPIRAILRHALFWGAAWAAAGGAVMFLIGLFTSDPSVESLPERIGLALFGAAALGVRFGIAGAVIGAAFSTAIRFAYRGRRIRDINPVRFALLGAVVGGVGVPLYLQLMNVLSGGSLIAWGSDAVLGAVFGGVVAGGAILLARKADPGGPGAAFEPVSEPGAIGGATAGELPAGSGDAGAVLERERVSEQR